MFGWEWLERNMMLKKTCVGHVRAPMPTSPVMFTSPVMLTSPVILTSPAACCRVLRLHAGTAQAPVQRGLSPERDLQSRGLLHPFRVPGHVLPRLVWAQLRPVPAGGIGAPDVAQSVRLGWRDRLGPRSVGLMSLWLAKVYIRGCPLLQVGGRVGMGCL